MPNKVDLNKVAKDLVTATKELSKDKATERIVVGELQRKGIQLKAVNRELEKRNKSDQLELDQLHTDIELAKLRREKLYTENLDLEQENSRLDDEIQESKHDLQINRDELTLKKQVLDDELEQYATVRKQEIKDAILEANKELITVRETLAETDQELKAKETKLSDLNQVYADEQAELIASNKEIEQLLEVNKRTKASEQQELEDMRTEVKQLHYDRDQLLAGMKKAKAEHEQFLDYERKARKILDTKDKELQKRSGEIESENQFLANRRSFLPKL